VAIVDDTPNGTYAVVNTGTRQSIRGNITVGRGGRITMNGLPIAVTDGTGKPIPNVYAIKNPAYQGTALVAANGAPDYDKSGNPSYVFADAQGRVIGQAGQPGWENAGLLVGSDIDMGNHAFFPVAYTSPEGVTGLALTRDGHFDVNANNELVDASGNPILPIDVAGKPLVNARIVLNPNYHGSDIFAADGTPVVYQGQTSYQVVDATGKTIPGARLGTVAADVTQLTPLGQSEFMVNQTLNPAQVLPALRPSTAQLKPGQVEQSNVDTTATMTQMLSVMAQYEANQRVIRTEDSLLAKAVEDVGKVNA
jgi:flagellar hook protein FlgE